MTILPVRFVYPNRPPRWKPLFLGGGAVWLACLLAMIWQYPHVSPTLRGISLIYPVVYVVLSVYLDIALR